MKMKTYLLAVPLFLAFLFPTLASATVVYLQDGVSGYTGTTDADLNTYSTSANTGSATTLRLGAYGAIKSVFKFDLSSIPTGSTINSATLNLYVESTTNNGGGDSISIYKILNSWTEAGATWNSLPSTAFASTPESSPAIGYNPSGIWVTVPLTSVVQAWFGGSLPNNGVMIATANGPQVNISSSENTNAMYRPKLVVDYTPPVSATPTSGGINGVCGGSHGTVTFYMPSVGLCSAGTPSIPSGTGPWTWGCAGINGGTASTCSATKAATILTPTATLSAASSSIAYNGTTTLSWSSANATSCTLSSGQTGISGTSSTGNLISSTLYSITCSGPGGSVTQLLPVTVGKAPVVVSAVDGVCSSLNKTTLTSIPLGNLCYVGSATPVTGNGPWTWSCLGSNNGISPTCSANKAVGSNEAESVTQVPSTAVTGAYYVSPSGADSNSCLVSQNIQTPKKTLASAFTCLSPGNTLYLLDGTYIDRMTNVPNGSATGGYITVAAKNEGGVIILGGLALANTNSYIIFQGLRFHGAGDKGILGHHLKFFKNEFKGGCPSGNCVNTAVGSNDFSNTSDILLEDNWWHGAGGRYNVLVYNANRVIVRRAVIRHDGGWTDTKGDPEAAINFYNTSNSSIQNAIVIDSDLSYKSWQGAFYSVYNSASPNTTINNSWYSNVVISSPVGCGFRLDGNGVISATVQDMYMYNVGMGACLGSGSSQITSSLDRITIDKAASGFVQYATSYTGSITNALLANVSKSTDKLSITSMGSGAQLKGIGVKGTLYGEIGWNSATGESFLPFSSEARIKKEMCTDVGVTRGFCGSRSLSTYITDYTGSVSAISPQVTITPTGTQTQIPSPSVNTYATSPTVNNTTIPSYSNTTSQTTSTTLNVTPITKQLKFGMEEPQVLVLQKFLESLGFLPVGAANGYFGYGTQKGLRAFQCRYLQICSGSVSSTGYGATGPRTRNLINSMNVIR